MIKGRLVGGILLVIGGASILAGFFGLIDDVNRLRRYRQVNKEDAEELDKIRNENSEAAKDHWAKEAFKY